MRFITVGAGFIVLCCVVGVSYSHTLELFELAGFTGYFRHMAVIGVEITFLLGCLAIVVAQLKGKKPKPAAFFAGAYGLAITMWANVQAGIAYGLHGILLGMAIPIGLYVVENLISAAVIGDELTPEERLEMISKFVMEEVKRIKAEEKDHKKVFERINKLLGFFSEVSGELADMREEERIKAEIEKELKTTERPSTSAIIHEIREELERELNELQSNSPENKSDEKPSEIIRTEEQPDEDPTENHPNISQPISNRLKNNPPEIHPTENINQPDENTIQPKSIRMIPSEIHPIKFHPDEIKNQPDEKSTEQLSHPNSDRPENNPSDSQPDDQKSHLGESKIKETEINSLQPQKEQNPISARTDDPSDNQPESIRMGENIQPDEKPSEENNPSEIIRTEEQPDESTEIHPDENETNRLKNNPSEIHPTENINQPDGKSSENISTENKPDGIQPDDKTDRMENKNHPGENKESTENQPDEKPSEENNPSESENESQPDDEENYVDGIRIADKTENPRVKALEYYRKHEKLPSRRKLAKLSKNTEHQAGKTLRQLRIELAAAERH